MRYPCYTCGKSVTSELPDDSIIRAALTCPECLELDKTEAQLAVAVKALEDVLRNEPYVFAECTVAETIMSTARQAIASISAMGKNTTSDVNAKYTTKGVEGEK